MKNPMRLIDLIYLIEEHTNVWIATSKDDADGIYFGDVGSVTCGLMRKCTVKEVYPERYPSRYCVGISIIVDMKEDK